MDPGPVGVNAVIPNGSTSDVKDPGEEKGFTDPDEFAGDECECDLELLGGGDKRPLPGETGVDPLVAEEPFV